MRARQRFLATEFAIAPTKCCSRGATRCCQCLKPQVRKNTRRAGIPRVRNQKRGLASVQFVESQCFFLLGCTHRSISEFSLAQDECRWLREQLRIRRPLCSQRSELLLPRREVRSPASE